MRGIDIKQSTLIFFVTFLLLFGMNLVFCSKVGPLLFAEMHKLDYPDKMHKRFSSIKPLSTSSVRINDKINILFCSKSKKFGKPLLELNGCYLYAKRLTINEIKNLIKNNDVISIEEQRKYKPLLFKAIPVIGGNLTLVNVTINGTNYTIPLNIFRIYNKTINGSGVRIAIIDTGINDTNPWFNNTKFVAKLGVRYNTSAGICEYTSDYIDDNGHGTHVAGIIHSIAPGAELIILKLLDWSDDDIICAINKAIELNASIISMSLGTYLWTFSDYPLNDTGANLSLLYGDFLYWYVNKKIVENNTTFVIAAGNSGDYPWHYNTSILPFENKTIQINITYPTSGIVWPSIVLRTNKIVSQLIVEMYNMSDKHLFYKVLIKPLLKNVTVVYADDNLTFDPVFLAISNYTNETFIRIETYWPYNTTVNITINNTKNETVDVDIYDYWCISTNCMSYNTLFPNTPYSTLASPGIAKYAITVGSFVSSDFGILGDPFGNISSFSSRGPLRYNYSLIKPEIVAPGDEILSANAFWTGVNNYYVSMSGTSMATPFISGAIALLKQIVPSATPMEVKAYLKKIADPNIYNLSHFDVYTKGYGLINLTKLVKNLPRIEINISDKLKIVNNSLNLVLNFTNYGLIRSNVYLNKSKLTVPANSTIPFYYPLNISNVLNLNNYTITLENITGEFVNEPLNLTININFTEIPYSYNYSFYVVDNNTVNVTILNSTRTLIIINNTTLIDNPFLTVFFNESEPYKFLNLTIIHYPSVDKIDNSNYYVSINVNRINISLPHPPKIVEEGKLNYSIFDVINITFNVTSSYFNITNISSRIGDFLFGNNISLDAIKLGEGNHTVILNISTDAGINFTKIYIIHIYKPKANISMRILNTNDQRFAGKNSTMLFNFTLDYLPINLTFNISSKYFNMSNVSITNYTQISLNLSNYNLSSVEENVSINFNIYYEGYEVYNKTFNIILDTKAPSIVMYSPKENVTYYKKVLINVSINDSYPFAIKINNKTYNASFINNTFVECKSPLTIVAYDLANNFKVIKVNVTCGNVSNITKESSIIDYAEIKNGTIYIGSVLEQKKRLETADKIINIWNKSVKINVSDNVSAFVILNFTIPDSYYFKKAIYVKNSTIYNITNNISIFNKNVIIPLRITSDPEVIVSFESIEEKPTIPSGGSTSSSSSSTSSSESTTITVIPQNQTENIKFFNITVKKYENTIKIIFANNGILSKDINITLPYITRITIIAKSNNTTGYFVIKQKNVSLPDFKIFASYEFESLNCTGKVYFNQSVLCYDGISLYVCGQVVGVSGKRTIIIGRRKVIFKPLSQNTSEEKPGQNNISFNNTSLINQTNTTSFKKESDNFGWIFKVLGILVAILIIISLIYWSRQRKAPPSQGRKLNKRPFRRMPPQYNQRYPYNYPTEYPYRYPNPYNPNNWYYYYRRQK